MNAFLRGVCAALVLGLCPALPAALAQQVDDAVIGDLIVRDGCARKQESKPEERMDPLHTNPLVRQQPQKKKKLRVRENFILGRITLNPADQSSPEAIPHLLKVLSKLNKAKLFEMIDKVGGLKPEDIPLEESYMDLASGMDQMPPTIEFVKGEGQFAMPLTVELTNPNRKLDDYLAMYLLITPPGTLKEAQKAVLKSYIERGGFLFADPALGEESMLKLFKRDIESLFPGRKFELLSPRHPLFRSFYDLRTLHYYYGSRKVWSGPPVIEALRVGCRAAVIISPYNLSCGWDRHVHTDEPKGGIGWVQVEDALRLGVNMTSYAMEYRDVNKPLARLVELSAPGKTAPDEFVFAQLRWKGEWNPDFNSTTHLVRRLNKKLNMDIQSRKAVVDLGAPDIDSYPFIYLTGHGALDFTSEEKNRLKQYLLKGGTLFADACCGNREFDESFQALMDELFGGGKLAQIPMTASLYKNYEDITDVEYSRYVRPSDLPFQGQTSEKMVVGGQLLDVNRSEGQSLLREVDGKKRAPAYLKGITIQNRYGVIYSPMDVGCGWKGDEDEGTQCGFSKGIVGEDAMKVVENVVVYALTE